MLKFEEIFEMKKKFNFRRKKLQLLWCLSKTKIQ